MSRKAYYDEIITEVREKGEYHWEIPPIAEGSTRQRVTQSFRMHIRQAAWYRHLKVTTETTETEVLVRFVSEA